MPFYMGIDETRYGFMDEGWATTFEYLWGVEDMGKARGTKFFEQFRVNRWAHDNSAAGDLAIINPGDILGGGALGINEYGKAAIGYLAMRDLLGDETFKKCLQAYMARWHGKHPSPWDFFYTFDDVAGRTLDWFWSNWFFSHNYIDLAVADVDGPGTATTSRSTTSAAWTRPWTWSLGFADGRARRPSTRRRPSGRRTQERADVHVPADGTLTSVGMDHGIWVDADTSNDGWKAKGS